MQNADVIQMVRVLCTKCVPPPATENERMDMEEHLRLIAQEQAGFDACETNELVDQFLDGLQERKTIMLIEQFIDRLHQRNAMRQRDSRLVGKWLVSCQELDGGCELFTIGAKPVHQDPEEWPA